jgi:hypothetical protein
VVRHKMPIHPILVARSNFTSAASLGAAFEQLVLVRLPALDPFGGCGQDTGFGLCAQHYWSNLIQWISKPRMYRSQIICN